MPHILEQSTLRILNPDGQTAGAGFIVAPGLAVTCAHVVSAAKSGPGQEISVAPYSGGDDLRTWVLEQGWSPEELDDLAFLRLEVLPQNIQPVALSGAQGRVNHAFCALGFPPDLNYAADRAVGMIHGTIQAGGEGRADLLQITGREIRPGMSGGPVLDTQTNQVVGMVCEIKDREGVRRAYAITAETIAAICPAPLKLQPLEKDIQQQMAEILTLFQEMGANIQVGRDVRSSVVISGRHNSLNFSLQDTPLVQELAKKLVSRRDLRSYLLWLVVRPSYSQWETHFVPLKAHIDPLPSLEEMDLPVSFSELRYDAQGQPQASAVLEDITQALDRHPAFIILGEPGCGKTTTLEKITFEHAKSQLEGKPGRIPLFVRLGDQRGQTPEDFLAKEWHKRTGMALDSELDEGRLLILADGVNEIGQAVREQALIDWQRFATEVRERGNQIVFSGRKLDYGAQLDLPQIEVERLDEPRIRQYVEIHHAQGLLAELKEQEQLWQLAQNPFYLKMLVWFFRAHQGLPANRAQLLGDFVKALLDREQGHCSDDRLPYAVQELALMRLAYAMQAQGEGTTFLVAKARAALPEQVMDEEGENYPIRPAALFRLARGALILDPSKKSDVRFYHQLMQEYFAARELQRRFEEGEDCSGLWISKRRIAEMPPAEMGKRDTLPGPPTTGWEVTTILAAGLAQRPSAFIAAVRRVNPVLAGRCLAEAGLAELQVERLGGLALGLQTRDLELGQVLQATRHDLLRELYDAQVHLRARLPAGLVLGKLGDPRFEIVERNGIRCILPDLVLVPGGSYPIGSQVGEQNTYEDETPRFDFDTLPFRIGRRPVTNAEFACFIEAGGYQVERFWRGSLAQRWLRGEEVAGGRLKTTLDNWRYLKPRSDWQEILIGSGFTEEQIEVWGQLLEYPTEEKVKEVLSESWPAKSRKEPAYWSDLRFNLPNQPVVGLTWFEACAYCVWLGETCGQDVRLPSEMEWEAAARGLESRNYPWGMDWDPDQANTVENRVMRTTTVGAYTAAGGVGPHGEEDQAGNVWEWTRSPYFAYPSQGADREDLEDETLFVVRGGSWNLVGRYARCASRGRSPRDYFNDLIGFRVFSPGAS